MEINIGANIKRLRMAKNITQEQLSVQMNVTCAAVSKWERGETYPDINLLQPLSDNRIVRTSLNTTRRGE